MAEETQEIRSLDSSERYTAYCKKHDLKYDKNDGCHLCLFNSPSVKKGNKK